MASVVNPDTHCQRAFVDPWKGRFSPPFRCSKHRTHRYLWGVSNSHLALTHDFGAASIPEHFATACGLRRGTPTQAERTDECPLPGMKCNKAIESEPSRKTTPFSERVLIFHQTLLTSNLGRKRHPAWKRPQGGVIKGTVFGFNAVPHSPFRFPLALVILHLERDRQVISLRLLSNP